MSFSGRDITQGGQVTFMRFRMFFQVNNIIIYYLSLGWFIFLALFMMLMLALQTLLNGVIFWWCELLVPLKTMFRTPPVFPVRYYGQKLYFTYDHILTDPYTRWCGVALRNSLILSGLYASLLTFLLLLGLLWWIGRVGRKASRDEITGGRILEDDPAEVSRMMKRQGTGSHIVIDGLPMVKDSEIQNIAMHGTVGTGKSTLIRKYLLQLRQSGAPVIIYDKGNTFVEEFFDETRDVILNPMDKRCANWDLWEECRTLPDLEAVAETLIPMGNSADPFWQGSARTIFAEGAEQMRGVKGRSYNRFLRTLLAISLEKLRDFLKGTPASNLVDGSIEKTAISIRSVLTNYVKSLRYLQGTDRPDAPPFTIREWMLGNRAMSQVCQCISDGHGRAITSGDEAQLRPVEPGQPFRMMQQRSAIDTAVMKEIVRQTPALRGVVYDMIDGQYARALEKVERLSPVMVPRQEKAYVPGSSVEQIVACSDAARKGRDSTEFTITQAIAADYVGRTAEARDHTLTVAHLNADRKEINALIHNYLSQAGETRNEQSISVLEPVRVRHNALRSVSGWELHEGAFALINREYWKVGKADRESGLVTLTGEEGRTRIVSPFENSAEEVQIYRLHDLPVSEGDKIRFTRSDPDRGYTGNTFWSVNRLEGHSLTLISADGHQTRQLDLRDPADRHIDLGYAVTAYGAQGASSRYVIALEGVAGSRKHMASKEGGYVTLSRTKEHVQVYTDDRAGWLRQLKQPREERTAHDWLLAEDDKASLDAVNRLSATFSLTDLPEGEKILRQLGLSQGQSLGVLVPPSRGSLESRIGFALWDSNGRKTGMMVTEVSTDRSGPYLLPGEREIYGGRDARFASIQHSTNGEVIVTGSLEEGFHAAHLAPDSGVLVRLKGNGLPLNLNRIVGGEVISNAAEFLSKSAENPGLPEVILGSPGNDRQMSGDEKLAQYLKSIDHAQSEQDKSDLESMSCSVAHLFKADTSPGTEFPERRAEDVTSGENSLEREPQQKLPERGLQKSFED